MGLRIWLYYFKNAFINILNNRLVNAICISTISVSLLLLGLFMLLFINLENWVMEWGKYSLSMSIYLKDGVNEKAKKEVESFLKNLPGAELLSYISKEKALMDLRRTLGGQSGLLDGLKENPLPASFEITFKDVDKHKIEPKKLKAQLEKIEGVDEVQYTEQWQERFEGLLHILRIGGFILGGFLWVAMLFIITNTIKLTIYSRREEIEILKLVGATDWFIKIPFLIEGAVQGLFSGLIAISILFLFYSLFFMKKAHVFGLPMPDIIFLPSGYIVSLLLLSVVLGLVGGIIAVGRFFNL